MTKLLLIDSSRWPCAARLAIPFSKLGADVSAVCPDRHPLSKTSVVRRIYPYSGLRPLASLATAIEATQPDLLIACDEFSIRHLHELHAQECNRSGRGSRSAALIEKSLGSPSSYSVVTSRFDLLRVAREERIRIPEMRAVHAIDDLISWAPRQMFPWILKADATCAGVGVRIAKDMKDARRFFRDLQGIFSAGHAIKEFLFKSNPFWMRPWIRRSRPDVIVQSYVQGHPANCAVACWEGKVLAGIAVEVCSTQGATQPATVVRVIEKPDMMLAAERLAKRLNLSGFFGLDFMIESRTGVAYLIEMNARCTPLCHLQLGPGRDLIGSLWAQLSGQKMQDSAPVTANDLIAYFPQSLRYQADLIDSSYLDVPEGETELIQDLLRPYPDRSLLLRTASFLQANFKSRIAVQPLINLEYKEGLLKRGDH